MAVTLRRALAKEATALWMVAFSLIGILVGFKGSHARPFTRNKILPARGDFADLQAGLASLAEGEICYAFDQDQYYQKEGGVLVSVGATKAQGALADTSLQPGDNISELVNDMGYLVAGDIVDAPVQSVNGQTGDVVLGKADVGLGNVDNTSDADKPVSTATQTQLDAKADLVNGVIPTSQIPAIAITEFLGDVTSESEMLALVGQPGDWCFRSDEGFGYVIVAEPPSDLANWQQIATSTVWRRCQQRQRSDHRRSVHGRRA